MAVLFEQVFGDEANMYQLEDVQLQDLGQVGEVTVTKDDTLMMKVLSSLIICSIFTRYNGKSLNIYNLNINILGTVLKLKNKTILLMDIGV